MTRSFRVLFAACCLSAILIAFALADIFLVPRLGLPMSEYPMYGRDVSLVLMFILVLAFPIMVIAWPYGIVTLIAMPQTRTKAAIASIVFAGATMGAGIFFYDTLNYAYTGSFVNAALHWVKQVTGPHIREIDTASVYQPLTKFLMDSPKILVGAVGVQEVAGFTRASRNGGAPVQLWRLNISIQYVLKGQPLSGTLNVYSYRMPGEEGSLQTPSDRLGQDYIFYLRKDGAEWRSACDPYERCADHVATGFDPQFKHDPNRSLGDEILGLLVAPEGEFLREGIVVDALAELHSGPSRRWIEGRKETYIDVLQKGTARSTAAIRTEACELLKSMGRPCPVCEKPKE